ncbi:MAG: S8 family serine peptidase [Ignisphaera sp.]
MAVGAIDRYYAVPSWSNRNPDVVAPGSGVLSTYPGNRHVIASGTSMACPHVSAAVALVQAVRLATGRQKLAPAQMIELIRTTAIDLGTAGYDALYGYGLIDAYRAVSESMTRFN